MAYDAATRDAQQQAVALLDQLRSVYKSAKAAQASLLKYQAGTSPVFNTALNALHPPAERAELGAMLTQVNALILVWETNHAAALNITQGG